MKTIHLNKVEVESIALAIMIQFRDETGEVLVPTTYKRRYSSLQERILIKVRLKKKAEPNIDASVSKGQLCKLFIAQKNKENASFNVSFLNSCSIYLYGREYQKVKDQYFFSNKVSEIEPANKSEKMTLNDAVLIGAAIGGIFSLGTYFLKDLSELHAYRYRLIPIIFLSQTLIGGILGFAFAIYVKQLKKKNLVSKAYLFCLIISVFIIVFFFRQIATRNALRPDTPLGQPDFEGMATALVLTSSIFLTEFYFRKIKLEFFENVRFIFASGLFNGVVFAIIYVIFEILHRSSIIQKDACLISINDTCTYFKLSFHYPLRVYLVILFTSLHFTIIYFLRKFTSKS